MLALENIRTRSVKTLARLALQVSNAVTLN
jgi:hypothetical protein